LLLINIDLPLNKLCVSSCVCLYIHRLQCTGGICFFSLLFTYNWGHTHICLVQIVEGSASIVSLSIVYFFVWNIRIWINFLYFFLSVSKPGLKERRISGKIAINFSEIVIHAIYRILIFLGRIETYVILCVFSFLV
jgi:hypothetical protein